MKEPDVTGPAAALIAQIKTAKEQAEQEVVNPAPATVADSELQRCPCCRWDLKNRNPAKPGEEDRKEYVRCILGKRRFSKAYSMFDGAVVVKFEVLSQEQADEMGAMFRVLSREDNLKLTTEALQIKLLFYLRQMHDTTFAAPTIEEQKDWQKLYQVRFKGYGEDIIILLTRALMEFLRLIEMLPHSGFDANFWKGAGLS